MTGDECKCPLCGADPAELRALRTWANESEEAGYNLFMAGYEAGYDVALEDAARKIEELSEQGVFDLEDEIRKLRHRGRRSQQVGFGICNKHEG